MCSSKDLKTWRDALKVLARKTKNNVVIGTPDGIVELFIIESYITIMDFSVGIVIAIDSKMNVLSDYSLLVLKNKILDYAVTRNWDLVKINLHSSEKRITYPHNCSSVKSYVRKYLNQSYVPSRRNDIVVRYVEKRDYLDCFNMLCEATRIGFAYEGYGDIHQRALHREAGRIIESVASGEGIHIVALRNRTIVGHAIGYTTRKCVVSGICDGLLIDVYVREGFRNQGISSILTEYWERELFEKGITSVRGMVLGPSRCAVLETISDSGWEEYAIEWAIVETTLESVK